MNVDRSVVVATWCLVVGFVAASAVLLRSASSPGSGVFPVRDPQRFQTVTTIRNGRIRQIRDVDVETGASVTCLVVDAVGAVTTQPTTAEVADALADLDAPGTVELAVGVYGDRSPGVTGAVVLGGSRDVSTAARATRDAVAEAAYDRWSRTTDETELKGRWR